MKRDLVPEIRDGAFWIVKLKDGSRTVVPDAPGVFLIGGKSETLQNLSKSDRKKMEKTLGQTTDASSLDQVVSIRSSSGPFFRLVTDWDAGLKDGGFENRANVIAYLRRLGYKVEEPKVSGNDDSELDDDDGELDELLDDLERLAEAVMIDVTPHAFKVRYGRMPVGSYREKDDAINKAAVFAYESKVKALKRPRIFVIFADKIEEYNMHGNLRQVWD